MISKDKSADSEVLPGAVWSFGQSQFDEFKWELRVNGAAVELEPRPLEILLLLLRHAGEAVTREELLLSVWGHSHLSENTLSNAIAKLRRALGDDSQSIIVTVHRVGYRLAIPVHRRDIRPEGVTPRIFHPGDPVPGRDGWSLLQPLAPAFNSEVWLGQRPDSGEQRVFKFSNDGLRLSSLKREATLSRLMQNTLDGRPDIIRVLDWSFEQPPFFIECEYGGLSLPQWAESQGGLAQVPLEMRLQLMAQAAEAVAAAHSVGVLHKDLKPANILVDRQQDGAWFVRLTDFGSGGFADPARLAELGAMRMGFTQMPTANPDSLSGTPLYLAPELLDGHAPTVQSDIYALGVILYQMSVGDLRRPLAPNWERNVGDELLRQDITDAASGDPAHRLSSARELAERLQHLDARRAQQLAERARQARQEETQRALDRSRARRPWLIAMVLVISCGLFLSLWFFRQSILARDEALRQFDIAQAVNDFLNNDLIASANPTIGGSDKVTVLEAMRKAADKINARFSQSPQVAIALHQTVGNAYRTLGNYAEAETEFRRAKAIADSALGPDSEASIGNDLLLAQMLAMENRYPDARAILDRVEAAAARRPFSDPMIGVRLWDVRSLFDKHNTNRVAAARDSDEVLKALHQLKAAHPKIFESNSQSVFLTLLHVAQDFQDAGRHREAEQIEQSLIDDVAARRGMADPLTIRARQQLVDNLKEQGRLEEAAALLPPLLHDAGLTLGGTNRIYLEILREQALINEKQMHWQAANMAAAQAEQGYRQLFGPYNDLTILTTVDRARILAESGEAQAAIAKYQEALAAAIQIQGNSGLLTQLVSYGLVDTLLNGGMPAQAAPLLSTLDQEGLEKAAPAAPWAARLEYQRGRLDAQSARPAQARAHFKAALEMAGDDARLRSDIAVALEKLH